MNGALNRLLSMPRIDPLLTAMVSNRADAIHLADGEVAHLIVAGVLRPLTKQALPTGQLVALMREVAPPDVIPKLDNGGATFVYTNAEGQFTTEVSRDEGGLRAVMTRMDVPVRKPNIETLISSYEEDAVSPPPPPRQPTPAVAQPELPPFVHNGMPSRAEIEELLSRLVSEEASDLHLRTGEPPLLRVHGELRRMDGRGGLTGPMIESMVRSIMPQRNLDEFKEVNDTDFAHEIDGLARFRANAFRDHHGAGAVFRVIPATVATVEQLGITPEVQNLCYLTKGLVLVTGPTGSGKSTTLGALVDLINRSRNDHVITIEDPIEFVHKNKKCLITQRQVGMHTASFKSALRAALREDPDIVLVGELRDLETISIALETAETGHLVFGTLHTTTAVGTIDRVIDQFPADRQEQIRVMLADTLKGVISQTLCKKIGGGRVAAREILLSVPAVSNLIRESKAFQIHSVMQTSRRLGMVLLGDVLIDLVDQGVVEPKEAYMKSTDKQAFLTALRSRGLDTSFVMTQG
jgi:twitching motility protein PilT